MRVSQSKWVKQHRSGRGRGHGRAAATPKTLPPGNKRAGHIHRGKYPFLAMPGENPSRLELFSQRGWAIEGNTTARSGARQRRTRKNGKHMQSRQSTLGRYSHWLVESGVSLHRRGCAALWSWLRVAALARCNDPFRSRGAAGWAFVRRQTACGPVA